MANILKFLQKKDAGESATAPAIAVASVDAQPFLPFYGHYSPDTLITKNGELLQTIRITANRLGHNYESGGDDEATLRELLRASLCAQIPSDEYAVWIHTLRKRKSVSFDASFDNGFSHYVNQQWRKNHNWTHHFYNEIYITIVHNGQSGKLFDKTNLKHGSTRKRNRALCNEYLEVVAEELNHVTGSIIDDLSRLYQAERLSVIERSAGKFYSEPMELFATLLNLQYQPTALPEADISSVLQRSDLLFGFNAIETKTTFEADAKKRFAAMLTLKHYHEVPTGALDILLQAPVEFALSQAFHFIPQALALKEYREQRELFELSGDNYSMIASGLNDMFKANHKKPTDFGHHQTHLLIMVDQFKTLEADVALIQKALGDLGLVAIREDIKLEETFWSIFPGNFEFLSRKNAINTARIGGFTRLNRFPSGEHSALHWNTPVALLPTIVGSPYFFNFHVRNNGHTLWLDFNSFRDAMGKTTLFFLLTQAQKLKTKLILMDDEESASLWFSKMQAPYHSLSKRTEANIERMQLNPFSLEQNPRNLSFLLTWCGELISDKTLSETEIGALKKAIEATYQGAANTRSLSTMVANLSRENAGLAAFFAPWISGGAHSFAFTDQPDNVSMEGLLQAFNLGTSCYEEPYVVPIFSYLLHRIITALDGTPTMIVFNNAYDVFAHPFFIARIESLMDMLTQRNAMIIFGIKQPQALLHSQLITMLAEHCATQITVPDDVATDYANVSLNLFTTHDQSLLANLQRMKGDILVKQNNQSVALRINLAPLEDIFAIYSNDIKSLLNTPKAGNYAK